MSQLYFKYQVLVNGQDDEPDVINKSGLSGASCFTFNFFSKVNWWIGSISLFCTVFITNEYIEVFTR